MQATISTMVQDQFTLTIYNDPFNKRIRIDDVRGNVQKGLVFAEDLAMKNKVEKLIVKGRQEQMNPLLQAGFTFEGKIDRYFLGNDCYLFCKYYSANRRNSSSTVIEDDIIKKIYGEPMNEVNEKIPESYILKKIKEEDCDLLAKLYQTVFKIYPTPLNDPNYIKQTLEDGTIYYAFFKDGMAVSAASAEINGFYQNAEITDCATLPEHRKHGLLKILITKLEEELVQGGIYCSYSLARALSYGMNKALKQLHYAYRGRLMNNCYIFEKIENMNVWVKDLSEIVKLPNN